MLTPQTVVFTVKTQPWYCI
uniref:Uncharacterized protein n=1 Tax=Anguilla anguilla TaxID=7936 RepID=A0A0E9PBD4_ANGAN